MTRECKQSKRMALRGVLSECDCVASRGLRLGWSSALEGQ